MNPTLKEELRILFNRHSAENHSDTPDFVLVEYVADCFDAFNRATRMREKFYGRNPGSVKTPEPQNGHKCPHCYGSGYEEEDHGHYPCRAGCRTKLPKQPTQKP